MTNYIITKVFMTVFDNNFIHYFKLVQCIVLWDL